MRGPGKNGAQITSGLLDALVLRILTDGDNYGFAIFKAAEEQLKEDAGMFREATLYPLLHKLEEKGLVESYWQPGDRGTDRKYYRITRAGRGHLTQRIDDWNAVIRVLRRTIMNARGENS
jgi:PadR family transcriptional regulator PadR